MNTVRSESIRKGWRETAFGWEVALLLCGYSGMFLGYMPVKHRLIICGICFPLAALASWWSGSLTIKGLPNGERDGARIVSTTPVLVFLGVIAVTAITLTLVLLGFF
jgi:hypothetical protein